MLNLYAHKCKNTHVRTYNIRVLVCHCMCIYDTGNIKLLYSARENREILSFILILISSVYYLTVPRIDQPFVSKIDLTARTTGCAWNFKASLVTNCVMCVCLRLMQNVQIYVECSDIQTIN